MVEARDVVRTLPSEAVGKCVLGAGGELFVGSAEALRQGLSKHELELPCWAHRRGSAADRWLATRVDGFDREARQIGAHWFGAHVHAQGVSWRNPRFAAAAAGGVNGGHICQCQLCPPLQLEQIH